MRFLLKKSYPNEKYSDTSPPTSPNSSNVKDTAVSSVLRCMFLNIFSKSQISQVKDVNQKVTLHVLIQLLKPWMACSNIMEIVPDSLVR